MDRPQHRTVSAAAAQGRQCRPECTLLYLPQQRLTEAGGHLLHLLPDGCKLSGQFAVAAPGIGDAEEHSLRQQTVCVEFFNLWGARIGKICKDNTAHRTGQLIQQAAGLAEIGIFRILANAGQLCRGQPGTVFLVPDGGHAHLERRRTGQPGAAQHIAGGIGIKAADLLAHCAESLGNAADLTGRVGALPCLRLCGSKINDIQFVEAPGLDPHIAIRVAGRHRHQIQRDRRRKAIAALMIRVVTAQLCPPRCRVHLHLPPGAEIQLELFQRRRIAPALPLQHRRVRPIKCSKCVVPAALQDLFSELCTGGHDSSSPPE